MTASAQPAARKPSLRWRKPKAPTGLARITWTGAEARELFLDGERVGTAAPLCKGHEIVGWYWYAHAGAESRNTASAPVVTRELAQDACMEWVKARL
jgi:hypothetical protein